MTEHEMLTRGRWGMQENGTCRMWIPAGYCWHQWAQGKSAWLHDTSPDVLSQLRQQAKLLSICLQKPCRRALTSATDVHAFATCLCSIIQGYEDAWGSSAKTCPLVGRTWLRPTLVPLYNLWHLHKLILISLGCARSGIVLCFSLFLKNRWGI